MAEWQDTGTTTNDFTNDIPLFEYKRFVLTIIIIILWICLGILGGVYAVHFYDLAVYFLSLTGFAGAYIISESKRPSILTSVFNKGGSSKREITIYITVALWLALGVVGILYGFDLIEAAAYFSALTPYVSTYLIGSAYMPQLPKSTREQMYQNNINYSATPYYAPTPNNQQQTVVTSQQTVVTSPPPVEDP